MAKKVHIQGVTTVLLANKVQNKNHNVNGYTIIL